MIAVFLHHIMVLPVILPLITGALLLFIREHSRRLKSALALVSTGFVVLIAAILIYRAQELAPQADVYNLGNWAAPFAIVFVLDRLSAVFLLMSVLTAFCALIYVTAHWDRLGAHFYSLSQFFLAGINGVFLTGDIFNLFVFFEVMLAASYALLMHGSGLARVRAGAHYVTVNLVASSCFLLGAACIYGGSGTLNMADLASRLALLPEDTVLICQIGMGFLGIAFLIKVGMWPLCFWVPATYSAAAAPVGALFSITGKVGFYVILRLSLLLLENDTTGLHAALCQILFYGGLITLIVGFTGVLASQNLSRLSANSVLASTGIVLAAMGLDHPALTAITVYYILSSTFALAAFFLLIEPVERNQDIAANVLAVTMEVYGEDEEEEEDEIGFYIPATAAILGACFTLCAILLIGMPPLSGFIAKFMMITGLFWPQGPARAYILPDIQSWLFIIFLVLAGFAQLIAMTRSGIRLFWASLDTYMPKVQISEIIPIAVLLTFCFTISLAAEPVMRYLDSMAAEIYVPANYIHSVLGGAINKGE
ncbi:monovalent cation/H+ antiporter subunit D [Candidatus Tokpelaia sp.]|uniref:monovalent cation/H+ antiporter subunit D n=1 Tax=Candidatus Tokpelaia sp. TaxID=2233777 RepID=UPI002A4E1AA6|nr:monovalent cation/H+ antiporter subunit D [Candidatus Tokpelaia sp.]